MDFFSLRFYLGKFHGICVALVLCDFLLLAVILGLIRVITGVLDAVSVGLGRNSKGFSMTNFHSVVSSVLSLLQGFQGKGKLRGEVLPSTF